MKKILLILLFIGSALTCTVSYAIETIPPTCDGNFKPAGGGGVVVLPWSAAKPFPWNNIQGIWSTNTDNDLKLFFVLKVTRSTANSKQLYVEIYDANDCKKANMRGVGVITSLDKNVLKANMNNVFLKMALFNTSDLEINGSFCKSTTLGATFYKLSDNDETSHYTKSGPGSSTESRTVLLKRVSYSTAFKCNKN